MLSGVTFSFNCGASRNSPFQVSADAGKIQEMQTTATETDQAEEIQKLQSDELKMQEEIDRFKKEENKVKKDMDLENRYTRYRASVSTVSEICCSCIRSDLQSCCIIWPGKEQVKRYMHSVFKEFYPELVFIIDHTERKMESPQV